MARRRKLSSQPVHVPVERKLIVHRVKSRDICMEALIKRTGSHAGPHKNKGMQGDGKQGRRHPKHKGQGDW